MTTLTKREQIAVQAMKSLIDAACNEETVSIYHPEMTARTAKKYANELVKEMNIKNPDK